jgi:hypothetical protein
MLRRAFSQGGTRQVPSKPDEKYWLERAKEAFTQVERLMHPEAKRMMLGKSRQGTSAWLFSLRSEPGAKNQGQVDPPSLRCSAEWVG